MRLLLLVPVALALVACVPKHATPERKTGALARGDKAYARGDLAAAEAHYTKAVEAGGAEAGDARYLRARVRVERGDLTGAESDASAVVAALPAHWEAHVLLGVVREKQGRRDLAIESFRRASEIAPRELSPRNNLAFLVLQDGREREAYELLVEIVRDHPQSARAWSNLALAADRLGLSDEAARAREKAKQVADADELEP